eukprot:jgi/Astpho2/605/Aster-x0026
MLALLQDLTMSISLACPQQTLLKKPQTKPLLLPAALPTLDIAEGALDSIFRLYKQLLPKMGGYLTHAGELNRPRLELLLAELAALEQQTLEQRAQTACRHDAEYMENKRSKRGGEDPAWMSQRQQNELDEADRFQAELEALSLEGTVDELALLARLEGDDEDPTQAVKPTMMGKDMRQLIMSGQGPQALQLWKDRYYREKLGMHRLQPESKRAVVQSYIEGLHWVLEYYYR